MTSASSSWPPFATTRRERSARGAHRGRALLGVVRREEDGRDVDDRLGRVGAGEVGERAWAEQHALAGAEFMAGIPGTVGGALAMNAGCFGSETWDIVATVTTVDRFGLVTWKADTPYMRMLQPDELLLAMGGLNEHVLPHGTRREKVKLCGNGVCSDVMTAIFRWISLNQAKQQDAA